MKLSIEKLVPNGLGLARHNGEVLLLPGALPGEDVSAEFGEMARGARRARVTEVLSASPFRVAADCPLAGVCGGCDFLHVAPAEALRLKAEAALGDLAERAGVAIELIQSPRSSRYRGRATVHLEAKAGGGVGVGFYSSPELRPNGERSLVEFADCLLLTEELNGLLEPLRRWASALPAGAGGAEISLLQGEADSGLAVHFSPKPNPRPAGRGKRPEPSRLSPILLKALAGLPPLLAEAGGPETAVFARAEERGRARKLSSGGRERLPMAVWPEFGLTLCAAPGGFTQVNPAVNRLMVKKILESAAPLSDRKGTALDLYSGLGNIALPLAQSGFAVTAVEESPLGAGAAKENGRGTPGFTVITGRSEEAVSAMVKQGRRFTLIALDPPRSGARDLAPALAALGPEMIMYVACHPAALARDLPAFSSLGYGLTNLTALDMFPRTSHLEALAVLVRT